jgi:hypothetical protein
MESQIISFGENKASVKQNTSGLWLCNELTITGSSISDVLVLMDHAIKELDKILGKYNKMEAKKDGKSI